MALVDITHGKTRHVHYRDSKLTFLLRVSSFCCLRKNPLSSVVKFSSRISFHQVAVGFQGFPRRTEENPHRNPDQLRGLSICGSEKTRIRENNHLPLFHILPTDGFIPRRIWLRARKKEKECLWTSLGKTRFIKFPSDLNVNVLSWLPPRSQYQLRWTNDVHRPSIFSFLHPHPPGACS